MPAKTMNKLKNPTLALLFAAQLRGCGMITAPRVRANAERDATELLGAHFPGTRYTVTCAGSDSDGDHYVSCTASATGPLGPNHPPVLTLDCRERIAFDYDRNCRITNRVWPTWGGNSPRP